MRSCSSGKEDLAIPLMYIMWQIVPCWMSSILGEFLEFLDVSINLLLDNGSQ